MLLGEQYKKIDVCEQYEDSFFVIGVMKRNFEGGLLMEFESGVDVEEGDQQLDEFWMYVLGYDDNIRMKLLEELFVDQVIGFVIG